MKTRKKKLVFLKRLKVEVVKHTQNQNPTGLCLLMCTVEELYGRSGVRSKLMDQLPLFKYGWFGHSSPDGCYCFKWGYGNTVAEKFYHYRLEWIDNKIKEIEEELPKPWYKRIFKKLEEYKNKL